MASASSFERFENLALDPPVRGFLHLPSQLATNGLVLTHGAGSNCQAPLLVAVANTFAGTGFRVLRCNLPYRQQRPFGPPHPSTSARDRAGLANAAKVLEEMGCQRVFMSGHSYGGRQATILASEDPNIAHGLILFSYPLHPPNKPTQLRTQHFPNLRTPSLFVHGTIDPFASSDELQSALKLIPARTRIVTVTGGGHDLGFKGKSRNEDLPQRVLECFREFFS